MPGKKSNANQDGVKQYIHEDKKRVNNPPVGLVTAETDHLNGKKTYRFDPHLDPQLQWAGKAEGISFDVDTVSLHVHERIDPLTIIEAVRKKEGMAGKVQMIYIDPPYGIKYGSNIQPFVNKRDVKDDQETLA